jgi:hypothetical protein
LLDDDAADAECNPEATFILIDKLFENPVCGKRLLEAARMLDKVPAIPCAFQNLDEPRASRREFSVETIVRGLILEK